MRENGAKRNPNLIFVVVVGCANPSADRRWGFGRVLNGSGAFDPEIVVLRHGAPFSLSLHAEASEHEFRFSFGGTGFDPTRPVPVRAEVYVYRLPAWSRGLVGFRIGPFRFGPWFISQSLIAFLRVPFTNANTEVEKEKKLNRNNIKASFGLTAV